MTVLGAVLVVLAVVAVIALVWLRSRRRVAARATSPGISEDLVARLTDEVRKWRAEAAHWRRTAERLQRELDGRGGP